MNLAVTFLILFLAIMFMSSMLKPLATALPTIDMGSAGVLMNLVIMFATVVFLVMVIRLSTDK